MSAAVKTCAARADGYARRAPEATQLYALVHKHWPVFLERAEEQGGLPRFVVRDLKEYLRCGVLEHGSPPMQPRDEEDELLIPSSAGAERRGGGRGRRVDTRGHPARARAPRPLARGRRRDAGRAGL